MNKLSFFFNDGTYGWSESYYDGTAGASLNATWSNGLKLARARQRLLAIGSNKCLPGQCSAPQLEWIRVSVVGSPRQTLFGMPNGVLFNGAEGTSLWPTAPTPSQQSLQAGMGPPDNPYSAILTVWRLNGGSQAKRPLSGVPDDIICDQALAPNSQWNKFFGQFVQALTTYAWGSLSMVASVNRAQPGAGSQITNVTQNAIGQPVITLAQGLAVGGGPGQVPNLSNVHLTIFGYAPIPGTPSINGTFRAFPGAAVAGVYPTWTLRRRFTPLSNLVMGYAVPAVPSVLTIQDVILDRPMKKDRGRPFGLVRGKSKARH